MIQETIIVLGLLASVNITQPQFFASPADFISQEHVLAKEELSLTNRLPDKTGNKVFADNIVLSIHYLKGDVKDLKKGEISSPSNIDWEKVRKPFEASFTLNPKESFAFHNTILPEYKDSVKYTMNSKFYTDEGYQSFAGLGGNGVCHIASLINWVSSKAGLKVVAKVNHDFSPIPGVSREYGTSIFSTMADQNLYVVNTRENPVKFEFKVDSDKVVLAISE